MIPLMRYKWKSGKARQGKAGRGIIEHARPRQLLPAAIWIAGSPRCRCHFFRQAPQQGPPSFPRYRCHPELCAAPVGLRRECVGYHSQCGGRFTFRSRASRKPVSGTSQRPPVFSWSPVSCRCCVVQPRSRLIIPFCSMVACLSPYFD